jgi:hypothetical protein
MVVVGIRAVGILSNLRVESLLSDRPEQDVRMDARYRVSPAVEGAHADQHMASPVDSVGVQSRLWDNWYLRLDCGQRREALAG